MRRSCCSPWQCCRGRPAICRFARRAWPRRQATENLAWPWASAHNAASAWHHLHSGRQGRSGAARFRRAAATTTTILTLWTTLTTRRSIKALLSLHHPQGQHSVHHLVEREQPPVIELTLTTNRQVPEPDSAAFLSPSEAVSRTCCLRPPVHARRPSRP